MSEYCYDEDQESDLKDMGVITTMLWIVVVLCLISLAYLLKGGWFFCGIVTAIWKKTARFAKDFGRYMFRTHLS